MTADQKLTLFVIGACITGCALATLMLYFTGWLW